MENSERFLNAFAAVEGALKQITQRHDSSFTTNVTLAAQTNSYVKLKKDQLIEYAQLRNAIVHHRVDYDEVIAEPHLAVVEAFESIANVLGSHKTVLDMVKQPVLKAEADDLLKGILAQQQAQGYSVVPVYEKNQFCGLIDEDLLQYVLLKAMQGELDLNQVTCAIVKKLPSTQDRVYFADAKAHFASILFNLDILFDQGKRVKVILVTEHGYASNPCLGVLTMADIGRIRLAF